MCLWANKVMMMMITFNVWIRNHLPSFSGTGTNWLCYEYRPTLCPNKLPHRRTCMLASIKRQLRIVVLGGGGGRTMALKSNNIENHMKWKRQKMAKCLVSPLSLELLLVPVRNPTRNGTRDHSLWYQKNHKKENLAQRNLTVAAVANPSTKKHINEKAQPNNWLTDSILAPIRNLR